MARCEGAPDSRWVLNPSLALQTQSREGDGTDGSDSAPLGALRRKEGTATDNMGTLSPGDCVSEKKVDDG